MLTYQDWATSPTVRHYWDRQAARYARWLPMPPVVWRPLPYEVAPAWILRHARYQHDWRKRARMGRRAYRLILVARAERVYAAMWLPALTQLADRLQQFMDAH